MNNPDEAVRDRWDEYIHELLKITCGGSREEESRRIEGDYRLSAAEVFTVTTATLAQRQEAARRVLNRTPTQSPRSDSDTSPR